MYDNKYIRRQGNVEEKTDKMIIHRFMARKISTFKCHHYSMICRWWRNTLIDSLYYYHYFVVVVVVLSEKICECGYYAFLLETSCRPTVKCIFKNLIFYYTVVSVCARRNKWLRTPGRRLLFVNNLTLHANVVYKTACTILNHAAAGRRFAKKNIMFGLKTAARCLPRV